MFGDCNAERHTRFCVNKKKVERIDTEMVWRVIAEVVCQKEKRGGAVYVCELGLQMCVRLVLYPWD